MSGKGLVRTGVLALCVAAFGCDDPAPPPPPPAPTPELVIDGVGFTVGLAVDDGTLFYTAQADGVAMGSLQRFDGDGEAPTVLIDGLDRPGLLALDATHVYVVETGPSDVAEGALWRVPRAGGSAERLASNLAAPASLALDESRVVVTTGSTEQAGAVVAVPLAGGLPTTLTEEPDDVPKRVAVHDDVVVYATAGPPTRVRRIEADGSATTLASIDAVGGQGLTVDATHAYVATFDAGIWRVKLDDGEAVPFAELPAAGNTRGMVRRGDALFFAHTGYRIASVALADGAIVELASTSVTPFFVTADANHVYWNEYGDGPAAVRRVALP